MREKEIGAARDGGEASKPTFKERFCRRLDIPPDIFLGESLMEIRGRQSVLVRGGCYILVYRQDEIVLAFKGHNLAIRGERLICTSYNAGAVSVEGLICSVSFEEVRE